MKIVDLGTDNTLTSHIPVLYILRGFFQAVRKLTDAKKLESSAHYSTDFGKE